MPDMMVDLAPWLLEVLVCPLTKGPLIYDHQTMRLISLKARLAYPIRQGIPMMLPAEALPLGDDEVRALGGEDCA